MRIHIICIGSELLSGHTLNTNLLFMGECLSAAGYDVAREVCIPDARDAIEDAVRTELLQADVVVTVGGLGPTSDDVTRPVIAELLGMPLRLDESVLTTIQSYLARRNVQVPCEALQVQALVPDGADVLVNRNGTAPGLWCPTGRKAIVMLPGPPRELQPMFVDAVLPRLRMLAPPMLVSRSLTVCGQPESVVAEKVETLLRAFPGVTPAYCAKPSQVDVRLRALPADADGLDRAVTELRTLLGHAALPDGCPGLVSAVAELLLAGKRTLATAESCTGGGIAAALTDLPGSSAFFQGSVVSYSNAWKHSWLGVSEAILEAHGAVSAETARAMLEGLLARYGTDAGIAVTGIAGPSGGTADKPVGLVYIATGLGEALQVERCLFPGNRENVRTRTITVALNQLRLQLLSSG